MRILIACLIGLAGSGLILSLVVHLAALVGLASPLGGATWGLHAGIFVVFPPAILAAQALTGDLRRRDFWSVALRGCPVWMRYMTYGFGGYAVMNFVLFFLNTRGKHPDELSAFRGFSGHWMAFYSVALATLFSYLRSDTAARR